MRKARRTGHQGQSHCKNIQLVPVSYEGLCVGRKSQIGVDLIQLFKKGRPFAHQFTSESYLRYGSPGKLKADRNGGSQKCGDEDPVLSDLRPGDSFHATQCGVDKNDRHSHVDANVHVDFEKSGEHDSDSAHLTGDVGEAHKNGAHDGHDPGGI